MGFPIVPKPTKASLATGEGYRFRLCALFESRGRENLFPKNQKIGLTFEKSVG
jgi:hypothetical protein